MTNSQKESRFKWYASNWKISRKFSDENKRGKSFGSRSNDSFSVVPPSFFSHHYVRSVHSAGSMLYVLNKSGDRCAEKFHNFSHNKRPNIGFRCWSHNRAYGFRLWEFSRVPFMVLCRFLMNVYCSGFSSVDYSVLYELFKTRIRSLNRHC